MRLRMRRVSAVSISSPSGRLRTLGLLVLVLALGAEPVWCRPATGSPSTPPVDAPDPTLHGIPVLDGSNVHNVGNILLHISNFGLIGSRPGSNLPYSGAPSAQWPKGSTTEYLYAAGLWVGAIKNGEPLVTTGVGYSPSATELEFQAGRSELDRIYRTRELAPGGARKPAPNADDDRDGLTDEDWLDGRDNDGDGRIDEDFAAISDQMFFCEYGDSDPNIKLRFPNHQPLDIWVQQSSMAWETPLVDDFVAFEFRVIARSTPLDDVYIGFFADSDIGPRGVPGDNSNVASDDFAGFTERIQSARVGNLTKSVKVSIGYMWDDDADEGASEGYVGLMFLGAQDPNSDGIPRPISLRNFRYFSGNSSYELGGDPTRDEERYRILDGTGPRSLPPPGPDGLRSTQPAKKKDDYRMVVSAGPFQLDAGDTLLFQSALVIGTGFEGMLDNAVQAQLTYDGAYLDCDLDPTTGVLGRETALCPPRFQGLFCVDPCDTNCVLAGSCDPQIGDCGVRVGETCEYVNADCEEELRTGIPTGVKGKECLIHWLTGTPPPPPSMRLVAHEHQVEIHWDNRSETTPDLRSNVFDFESYRIWRADDWKRPYGTDAAIGPGAELWSLLAEFDLVNAVGGNTGLEQLRYRPAIPDEVVQYYREWFRAHPFLQPPDLPGFNQAQLDTARALARGVRYYHFIDPPFRAGGRVGGPCPVNGPCPPIQTAVGAANARCNADGRCQETLPPPHSGAHYFYAVTATDHAFDAITLQATGPGLAGDPSSNFIYLNPPTDATPIERAASLDNSVYVVPNPATAESMKPWTLAPNNDDPTGIKVEFHHLPQSTGRVKVFTLSGDLVKEMYFDGSGGNGTLAWDLVSRNGQDVASGVYLYTVEADDNHFDRFVGKFVVIR